jgi:hypothetical protein
MHREQMANSNTLSKLGENGRQWFLRYNQVGSSTAVVSLTEKTQHFWSQSYHIHSIADCGSHQHPSNRSARSQKPEARSQKVRTSIKLLRATSLLHPSTHESNFVIIIIIIVVVVVIINISS